MENIITMKNKELVKGFNESVGAKKTNRFAMLLITGFSGVITLSVLVLYFFSNLAIADKVKVFDSSGREVETELKYRTDLINSGVQSHVYNAMYYLNSGDRNTLNGNRAKALFLVDRTNALSIFERWKKEKAYNDILRNGHVYKILEVKVTHVNIDKGEPFPFRSEATLLIQDGPRQEYYLITAQGVVTYETPSFPNNQWGMKISDYTQNYTKVNLDE